MDGYKYYLIIVDEFTRYSWIYPLKAKSDVATVLSQFITFIDRQFTNKVKVIQCDNGGEFTVMRDRCVQLGILMRHSCPYTHQQNGLAERKHQHVTEVGLAMLAHASLPMTFWWEAFHTAVLLINLLPTPVLQNSTPYQKLYNIPPDYSLLRTFGCACFPFLRPYSHSKLQFRSAKYTFIGYCNSHKGYKCLHSSGRIYIVRTVEFNETSFPFSENSVKSSSQTESPILPTPIPDFSSSTNSQNYSFPSTYSPLHQSDTTTKSQSSSNTTDSSPPQNNSHMSISSLQNSSANSSHNIPSSHTYIPPTTSMPHHPWLPDPKMVFLSLIQSCFLLSLQI